MLLLIDNYDSFTYNLAQYFQVLGEEVKVMRNDALAIEDIGRINPDYLVISPGPCTPKEAGISVEAIKRYAGKMPILGVCLGHQSIAYAFGAKIVRANKIMHGKTSLIHHDGQTIFQDLPNPFVATRYHSLVIDKSSLPSEFIVTAYSEDDNEIMAIRHQNLPLEGVQFHPESILTTEGLRLLKNFLEVYKGQRP